MNTAEKAHVASGRKRQQLQKQAQHNKRDKLQRLRALFDRG